ncbi:MAG: diguanylate cyclase [Actinomycetota bacterium]|nr:diguanylate cyclase [Actinomycetota bacterium]
MAPHGSSGDGESDPHAAAARLLDRVSARRDTDLPRLSPGKESAGNVRRLAVTGLGAACLVAALALAWVGGSAFLVGALLAVLAGAYLLHRSWLDRRTEVLKRLAGVDDLTGLGNQRVLWEALSNHIEGARPGPLSLVMVDVDSFKEINERYGHQVGDAVLRATAISVKEHSPREGLCFRYGGDELLVIAPGTVEGAACELAEDIRHAVANQQLGLPAVTVSCGIAQAESSWGPWELMDRADRALHAAKRTGRNRVVSLNQIPADAEFQEQEDEVDVVRRTALEVAAATLLARDSGTAHHADDVVTLAGSIASRLGIKGKQREELLAAAKLHDIGKVAIGPEVLNKPGPLNAEEWTIMRQHTPIGERILRAVPHMAEVATIVRHSHEHYDGGGYPDGLSGKAIPLASRIILCADAFHAIRSDRPYRRGRSAKEAMQEVRANSGTQFDPTVVDALEKAAHELRGGALGKIIDPRTVASPRLLALLLTMMMGGTALAASPPLRHWAASVINGGSHHRAHPEAAAHAGCGEAGALLCAVASVEGSTAGLPGSSTAPSASQPTHGARPRPRTRRRSANRPAGAGGGGRAGRSGPTAVAAVGAQSGPPPVDASVAPPQPASLFVDAVPNTQRDGVEIAPKQRESPRRTGTHGPRRQPQQKRPPARGHQPSHKAPSKPHGKGEHPDHSKGAPDKPNKGAGKPDQGKDKSEQSHGGGSQVVHTDKPEGHAGEPSASPRQPGSIPADASADPGAPQGSSSAPADVRSVHPLLDTSGPFANPFKPAPPGDEGLQAASEGAQPDASTSVEELAPPEISPEWSDYSPAGPGQDESVPQDPTVEVPAPAEEPSDVTTEALPPAEQPPDQAPPAAGANGDAGANGGAGVDGY